MMALIKDKRTRRVTIGLIAALLLAGCAGLGVQLTGKAHEFVYDRIAPAACDAQRAARAEAFGDLLRTALPEEQHSRLALLTGHLDSIAAMYRAGGYTPERQELSRALIDAETIALFRDLHADGLFGEALPHFDDPLRQIPAALLAVGINRAQLLAQVSIVPCPAAPRVK